MSVVRSALIGGAFLLATATSGFAQDVASWLPNGLYLRGDVGGAFGNKVTATDNNPSALNCDLCTGSLPATTGNSVLFGGGVGYRFNPMFRADLTLDYIPSFKLRGTAVSGGPGIVNSTASADLNSLVGMANGYLDLNGLMPNMLGPFQPYIDGGLGFARNDLGTISGNLGGVTPYTQSGATETNFAWGVGAGAGFAITPNLTLDLAYKYLNLGEVRTGNPIFVGAATFNRTGDKSDELTAHTVTVGLRFAFGAPAAPPPPTPAVAAPPAPPPAKIAPSQQMFIVFFEFDKSSLTADGKKVVDAAAAAFKAGKSGVAIAGYTDLAGTAPYNLALSKRRADIVKSALVKDGVPGAAIDETWHGKQNPRVPTADGVREPQNRRVEITM
jgi:outer membrane protein OmpA-like peptidoglycan-associated protein